MKIWVMQGSYEGEMYCSTHLTEKGAAMAAIGDLLGFLDVGDEESALSIINDEYQMGVPPYPGDKLPEPIEWDQEKMKSMTRKELWKIFRAWCEISWDRMAERGYNLDVNATDIQA
jgi:hypothetical protein